MEAREKCDPYCPEKVSQPIVINDNSEIALTNAGLGVILTAVPELKFAYDSERASNASLWLLARHNGKLERLKLIKLVFLADRLHLARYGRPIIGGLYSAMPHGPVASDFFNALKTGQIDGIQISGPRDVLSLASANEDFLSETDIEVLDEVNRFFGSRGAWNLRVLTHTLQAWKKNDPGESSLPLPYEDFFLDLEDKDHEILDLIKDDQEARSILEA